MTKGFLRFLRGNTIALLALFLALGGTTYAASSSLIRKNTVASPQVVNGSLGTVDLSTKARAALKGNRGLRGLTGAQGAKGATGAQGMQGIQGSEGPFPGTLPSGKTLRGTYSLTGIATAGSQAVRDGFSYVFTLASNPAVHYVPFATSPSAQCPGTAASPQALAGNLCVFETYRANAGIPVIADQITGSDGSNRQGFYLVLTSTAAAEYRAQGTWAVTSP